MYLSVLVSPIAVRGVWKRGKSIVVLQIKISDYIISIVLLKLYVEMPKLILIEYV